MECRKIDIRLLGAMQSAGHFPNVPYDLKQVKILEKFAPPGPSWREDGEQVRDWLQTEKGNYSLIGAMPNLSTLLMIPQNCEMSEVADFSFLKQCTKLKKLDVSCTNFRDCAILKELPALRWVKLPHPDQLVHREVLQELKAAAEVSDRLWQKAPQAVKASAVPEPPAEIRERWPEVSVHEGVYNGAASKIQRLAEELRSLTGIPAYRLRIDRDRQPGLFDSKFGGLPYWTPEKRYPKAADGKPMQLLAQLNLGTLGVGKPFPQKGMLQFFAAQDGMFGCNFGDSDQQEGYRIVYHETVDYSVTPEQVRGLGGVTMEEARFAETPVYRECAVHAEPQTCYINDCSSSLEPMFRTAVKNAWGEEIGEELSFRFLGEEEYEELFESLRDLSDGSLNGGHWMLGYPNFTQDDPRDPDSLYDTQLLQMDSMYDEAARDYLLLWGDCGVANFFIPRENLEKCDFSRVLYTWDCC